MYKTRLTEKAGFKTIVLLVFMILCCFVLTQRPPASEARNFSTAPTTPTPFPCQQATTCIDPPVVTINSPQAPCDVCNFSGGFPIAFFDDYSWRTFIALVWPADVSNNQRGVPDVNKTVADPEPPRVFETYKALWQVFHSDGSAPVPWDQNDLATLNACHQTIASGDLVLASFSKFSDVGQAFFGSLVGPLIAQNRKYVHYLTAYNQIEFDKILTDKLYDRNELRAKAPISFADGSIDIKSAWIDLDHVSHPERYYQHSAWIMDAEGNCEKKEVGLVGLHIVQKTPTRPQWIWSTFEQVDNVPPAQAGAPGTFGFNDGSGAPMITPNPHKLTPLPVPVPTPFNIERVMPIHPSTENTNRLYQQALKTQGNSVWQFYQLVMTQWPIPANAPNSPPPATFPPLNGATSSFANTTMETFEQGRLVNGRNVGGFGCIGCHTASNAAPFGTDFLWSLRDHASPSEIPSLLIQDPAFRTLKNMMLEQNRQQIEQSLQPQSKSKARKSKRRR